MEVFDAFLSRLSPLPGPIIANVSYPGVGTDPQPILSISIEALSSNITALLLEIAYESEEYKLSY